MNGDITAVEHIADMLSFATDWLYNNLPIDWLGIIKSVVNV